MKIYTKTGDAGETSLYNGARLPKDDACFCALGDVDELNSLLGVAREFALCHVSVAKTALPNQLERIQSLLLDLGSAIATPLDASSTQQLKRTHFDPRHVDVLEEWIDCIDQHLPRLTRFILPSGGRAASFLHLARTVCRRAERRVVSMVREGHCSESVMIFLNRLSDYLFTAARYSALMSHVPEVTYQKPLQSERAS